MFFLFLLPGHEVDLLTLLERLFFVIGVLYCNLDSYLFKRLQYCFFSSPSFMPLEILTSSTPACREYCFYFTIRFFDECHSVANIFLWVGCIFLLVSLVPLVLPLFYLFPFYLLYCASFWRWILTSSCNSLLFTSSIFFYFLG